jgi:hypothetical protein
LDIRLCGTKGLQLLLHSFLVYNSHQPPTEEGPDLISGQSMWHLRWKMWQSSRLSAISFGFCCQHHSTNAPRSNWHPYHQYHFILATDKITIWNVTLALPPPTLILILNFKKQYWIFQFCSFFPFQKQILTCTNIPHSFQNYTCTEFWRSTIKKKYNRQKSTTSNTSTILKVMTNNLAQSILPTSDTRTLVLFTCGLTLQPI